MARAGRKVSRTANWWVKSMEDHVGRVDDGSPLLWCRWMLIVMRKTSSKDMQTIFPMDLLRRTPVREYTSRKRWGKDRNGWNGNRTADNTPLLVLLGDSLSRSSVLRWTLTLRFHASYTDEVEATCWRSICLVLIRSRGRMSPVFHVWH